MLNGCSITLPFNPVGTVELLVSGEQEDRGLEGLDQVWVQFQMWSLVFLVLSVLYYKRMGPITCNDQAQSTEGFNYIFV